MDSFDVIVVGLGAMGSAATYHLARAGHRVLGIDRFSPPHPYGSTHGDTRITRQAVGEGDAYVPLVRRSHELWRDLEAETGQRLFRQVGGLLLAPASGAGAVHGTDDFFAATLAIARRHRIEHEILDAAAIKARYPQFHLGDADVAGYFEPGAGLVMADDAVRAHLDQARRHGAQLHCDERVTELASSSDGAVVTTDQGRYGAHAVLLTTGPWVGELLPPEFAGTVQAHRQVMCWFPLIPAGAEAFHPDRCPVFIWQFGDTHEDVFYGFPAIDGRDGGVKVGTEGYGRLTDVSTVDRDVSAAEVAATFDRCLRGRLPALAPGALRSVSCLYTVTPDFDFVIDRHPDHPQVIVASPCSGHGFKHSPAIGEALAELATAGASTLDLTPFRLARFG